MKRYEAKRQTVTTKRKQNDYKEIQTDKEM